MWLIYSLLCAFSVATSDALSKRAMRDATEWVVGWVRLAYALPFLFLGLWFVEIPLLDSTFWWVIAVLLPLELGSYALYLSAMRTSPPETTLPLLALTPLFVIVAAHLILGERVSAQGLGGVLLVSAGSYFLGLGSGRGGWLRPLAAVARDRGARTMLAVALIYSVTSVLGKVGLQHSSPAFFAIAYYMLLCLAFTPIAAWNTRAGQRSLAAQPIRFALIGFFFFCMVLFHYLALALAPVPYMISIKRSSMVLGFVYGRLFFRETSTRRRLFACALVVAGAVLVASA